MKSSRITTPQVLAAAGLIGLAAIILLLMGREPICTCGNVKLWHGEIVSSENSQHLSDWYSPSHLIHGFIFYGLLWLFARRTSLGARLLIALVVECGWEILENTDFVINRYREATVSLDYYGDSVVNSLSDLAFMLAGFLLAWRLPAWVTVGVAVALELFTGVMVRDNLTLNVIMLLWPVQAIKTWQGG